MEEIKQLLDAGRIEEALNKLKAFQKDTNIILKYHKEFKELDRKVRDSQAGKVQKKKEVKNDKGEVKKIITPVVIPIPFQNKIVSTATAFEVGRPPLIIPSDENELSEIVIATWRNNRLDSKLQELVRQRKAYTECAILFYIEDLKKGFFNRYVLKSNQNKEIKSRILSTEHGQMAPYYDANGDMVYFTWLFDTKNGDKNVNNRWVYDNEHVYMSSNETGVFVTTKEKHGFDKIPIVYTEQDKPEWHVSELAIDRYEVALSKLANSNDYSAHPILKTVGEVRGLPDKDEDGKTLACDIDVTESGQVVQSDASYLTHDNAPESMRLELETLEKNIYSLTSTPDISFDNVKGIGNLSGIALKLMFLDPTLKASNNEGQNRTMISRMVNVIVSGITTTSNPGLASTSQTMYFEIEFASILPDDLKTMVETLTKAVGNKPIMSQKTAVELLGQVSNVDEELAEINYNANQPPTPPKE